MDDRIVALERRVELLERLVISQQPLRYHTTVGCVCPVGAEVACASLSCPRRSYFQGPTCRA